MYTHVCIYIQSPNTFSIHSSIIGHLVRFHILAIVLSAAIYSGMHRSLWVNGFVSWGKIPRSEIARYMSALFLFSENLSHCFPLGLKQTTSLPAVGENSFFTTSLPTQIISTFVVVVFVACFIFGPLSEVLRTFSRIYLQGSFLVRVRGQYRITESVTCKDSSLGTVLSLQPLKLVSVVYS